MKGLGRVRFRSTLRLGVNIHAMDLRRLIARILSQRRIAIGSTSAAVSLVLFVAAGQAKDRQVDGFPDLPPDARSVAERSLACQHFRGEINGRGDERDKEVAAQLRRLKCDQIADDLDRIRVKYRHDAVVLKILDEVVR